MSILQIMDASGHTTLEWTRDDLEALANAERAFNEAVPNQGVGFDVSDPATPKIITTFDPEAERLLVAAPLVGG